MKKGDKITLLTANGDTVQLYVIGRSKQVGGVRAETQQKGSTGHGAIYEPVLLTGEGTQWIRGWDDEARDALLASAAMAAPAAPDLHLPLLGAAVMKVASRVVGLLVKNPVAAVAIGSVAAAYVTEKLRSKS